MENVIETDKGSVEEDYEFINIAERLLAQTAYYWPNRPEWLAEYASVLNQDSIFSAELTDFRLYYVYDHESDPELGPFFPPEETAVRVELFKQVIDTVIVKFIPMTLRKVVAQLLAVDQNEDGLDTDPARFTMSKTPATPEKMREGIERSFGYLLELPEEKWQEIWKPRVINLLQQLKTLV